MTTQKDPAKIADPLMERLESLTGVMRALRADVGALKVLAREAVQAAHEALKERDEARAERDRALKALAEERCAALLRRVPGAGEDQIRRDAAELERQILDATARLGDQA